MKSTVSVQVDTDTMLRLISHLKVRGGAQDVTEAITCAIELWMREQSQYARVVGDEIIHNGKSVTPNEFAQSFARSMRNAWMDLSVRRPQDKHFKMAHRLRLELAEQPGQPQTASADLVAPVDSAMGALLATLLTQLQTVRLPAPSTVAVRPAQPGPPRPLPAGEGWGLPERRKFRFRIEDVAFD